MRKVLYLVLLFVYACGVTEDKKEEKSEIVVLSEKITQDPLNTSLLLDRVNYNLSKNNLESALFDLKECVRIDSLNPKFHYLSADTYFNLSKLPNANAKYPGLVKYHLEKVIALSTDDFKAHALMGELLLAYAKYKEAIASFNTSLKIEYNQAKTHLLLGYTFKQLNQTKEAVNCFRNAVNVDPAYKEAFVQLGQIFHLEGDTTAVQYYNNALSIDPTDEIVLYNKALFYQSIKDWNNALDAYADLHKVNAFHSSGHYNIGFIHMELGLYDVASNNFSDAIYSNSELYEAYYSRGNCFETLGNIAQAEVDYKRAIEINPNYTYAVEALESLREKNKKYNK